MRLGNAKTEMDKRDVPGFFDGVVVNDELEAAFVRLKGAWGPRAQAAVACARVAAWCEADACSLFCSAFIAEHVTALN